MFKSDLRIILCHLCHHFSPESGGIQYIGFIHAGHLFPAFHGNIKTADGNPADLLFVISQYIHCRIQSVHFFCLMFAEIQTSGQFTHDHHVKALIADFFFQRTGAFEFVIQICGTKVGEQAKRFSQFQKTGLRSFGRFQLVPWRCGSVAADRSHQYRVTLSGSFDGLIRKRYTMYINGCSAHQKAGIMKGMAVFFTDLVEYFCGFPYDLRTDAVPGNQRYIIFHGCSLL